MTESQWNYLGLSHNPFSDPQKEFFPGADRELLLTKVRALSEWSRPIVALTGPHGVGKTCLFRALSSSLEAGVVAARVNGSLVSRAGDVLSALVQGYGVAAPSGADAPLLIELIIAHLKDQAQNERKSLVLVDDAHLLEQRAVDDLVNLAAAGAHLAFFSEPQFVESLQRAVERNSETAAGAEKSDMEPLLWHEMLLSPFSREQTAEYLAWRFEEAGYNGRMPFSEYQVNGIHRTSDGYPGRLDFAANEQLLQMTVGGGKAGGIPRKHLWLAATLAAVLGLFLWLWSPNEDDAVDSKVVTLEMPKSGAENAPGDAGQSATPETIADAPRQNQAQPKLTEVVTRGATESQVAETTSLTNPSLSAEGIGDGSEAGSATSADRSRKKAVTLSRTVEPVDPKPVVAVPSESRTVRVERPARTTPERAKPTPVVESVPVAKVDPVPEPKPKPKPKPAVTERGAFANAANTPRNASWLLAQSDSSYTIQLIGFGDAERAKNYLAEQPQAGRFALFRTRSGDRVVNVVTYGIYDSRTAAEAAVGQLPDSIGKVSPWVRPIGSVKSAIKTALQSDG